jgi:hypothetical protein
VGLHLSSYEDYIIRLASPFMDSNESIKTFGFVSGDRTFASSIGFGPRIDMNGTGQEGLGHLLKFLTTCLAARTSHSLNTRGDFITKTAAMTYH